jgi:hypothetical protein
LRLGLFAVRGLSLLHLRLLLFASLLHLRLLLFVSWLHLLLLLPWLWPLGLLLARLLDLLSSCVIGLLTRRPLTILRLILLDSWRCLILLARSLLIALVLLSLSGISGVGGSRTIVTLHAIRATSICRSVIVCVLVWPTPILIPLLVGGALAWAIARLIICLPLNVPLVAALVG